jgi:pimeloyl-ACP methyl ester carboxylesterase
MGMSDCPEYIDLGAHRIAFRRRSGSEPTLVFFPGYASDMEGAKALALDAFAERRNLGMLRFDYSGTGSSAGRLEDGTLEAWLEEALALVDRLTNGPLLLVGSSMGAWIAVHLALARSRRIQALVGIAAAPDFTAWGFADASAAERQGISRSFWQSGQRMLVLDGEIALDCPVRLIHGDADQDVPLDVAFRLMRAMRSGDVQLQIIKGGGHRLSEPRQIETIVRTVGDLTENK